MSVFLGPIGNDAPFYLNSLPMNGGQLFTFLANSTTPAATYTDSTGTVQNDNPIILNSSGYPQKSGGIIEIWQTGGIVLKYVLKDINNVVIWTRDNVSGINDASVSVDQWPASGLTPTFLNSTQYTVPGDQTTALHIGRRQKFAVTAGTVYGEISASVFTTLTTVTVYFEDGTSLDSGLSAINNSILTQVNDAVPRGASVGGEQDVASATTTNIGAVGTENIRITGTTTITGFGTANKGVFRRLRMQGALTLTYNATSMILPGAASIVTVAGDVLEAVSLGSGNWYVGSYTRSSGNAIVSVRSNLAGCTMSTAGASSTLSISAGQATDSTNVSMMQLAAIAKTTAAWAVGTATGGLDTGSIANSTWYHFYVIQRLDTGVVDVVYSTNATSPAMPANYTLFRRIGSGKTNGSAQWTLFFQNGDDFTWDVPVNDVNVTNPGTAAVTRTVTTPTGIVNFAKCLFQQNNVTSTTINFLFTALAQTDTAPSATLFDMRINSAASISHNVPKNLLTNTSAQFRTRQDVSGASDTFQIVTLGWIDSRGRNA